MFGDVTIRLLMWSCFALPFLAGSIAFGEGRFDIPPWRQNPAYDVPFYTGAILPTPQQAQYSNEFIPLGRVGIVLGKDVARDDPRLALLLERLTRCGSAFEFVQAMAGEFDSFIAVGDTAEASALNAPQRPESYLISSPVKGKTPLVVLKGSDRLGLLWAIASFNQLVTKRDGRPVARKASVLDYPDVAGKRAFTAMAERENPELTWFAANLLRPNVVVYRMTRQMRRYSARGWRDEKSLDDWKARVGKIAALLGPLGIEWYDSIQPITGHPETNIRSKSDEDFQTILRIANALAEAGGNLCLLYDDVRFPLSHDDKKDFGTAREADAFFLNKLYAAVTAKHPKFKILFCPPFYWGPASNIGDTYGEPRDEYLAAIGRRLPQGIHVYWTGPRVKSGKEDPEDVRWFTGLIQRKPVFWQNTFGVAHGGEYYNYPTDPIPAWRDWYYEGFFDDLAFHTVNTNELLANMTLVDCLWNRRAYDPERSIVEAGRKVIGPDAYPKLVALCKALEALDIYAWSLTAAAAKNVEDVKQKTAELLARRDEALAVRAEAINTWTWIPLYISLRERYLERLLKNPNLKHLTEADDLVKTLAAKETGANAQTDIILTPNDFRLQRSARYYGADAMRRFVVWINGAKTNVSTMQATFRLKEPPTSDFELVIAGLDHEAAAPCRIRILANGHKVFEGPNPFAKDKWTTHAFKVPGQFLKDNENSLVITNIEDSDNLAGAPWFMLSYAVVRKAK